MLVAYPLPDKGYRYPMRRGSGLFISSMAFGDASNQIISRIVPRFFFLIYYHRRTGGDEQSVLFIICIMNSLASFLASLYIGIILLYVFFGIIFGVVVSLIFRPYILWYFKINKRIKLQEETNKLLNEISSKRTSSTSIKTERDYSSYMPK